MASCVDICCLWSVLSDNPIAHLSMQGITLSLVCTIYRSHSLKLYGSLMRALRQLKQFGEHESDNQHQHQHFIVVGKSAENSGKYAEHFVHHRIQLNALSSSLSLSLSPSLFYQAISISLPLSHQN